MLQEKAHQALPSSWGQGLMCGFSVGGKDGHLIYSAQRLELAVIKIGISQLPSVSRRLGERLAYLGQVWRPERPERPITQLVQLTRASSAVKSTLPVPRWNSISAALLLQQLLAARLLGPLPQMLRHGGSLEFRS